MNSSGVRNAEKLTILLERNHSLKKLLVEFQVHFSFVFAIKFSLLHEGSYYLISYKSSVLRISLLNLQFFQMLQLFSKSLTVLAKLVFVLFVQKHPIKLDHERTLPLNFPWLEFLPLPDFAEELYHLAMCRLN